eukprot:CAMPEP_0206451136 /NCGR_PEP_ID=MMETSP0324_2-20121206/19148_1 /ASSEMBLY_ACC=CAM_ASM_000836 /TAXON_ID=2866 /ORGANISM="Crypthecodinium cohnii, Strain Seligo" /LENGTH=288 /DNA_ID=CAMNT_0053920933 /DNA_START=39 /DNA_END=902 /DNA_ORIENTATION=+
MAEGVEALKARHEEEEQELEEKIKSKLEAIANSGQKGKKLKMAQEEAEREIEQWRYELTVKHQDELEELGGDGNADEKEEKPRTPSPPKKTKEEEEAEKAAKKKEKAAKKREKQASKEAEKEKEKAEERRNAGPARRDLELKAIAGKLAMSKPPRRVFDVAGDGHCLYRAVADQILRYRPTVLEIAEKADAYLDVRKACATALRARPEAYEAFAELNDGEDYAGYCSRVESSADWGGQLELRALSDELGVTIAVHRAEQEDLLIGDDKDGEPLHVTYHQFWYALGEHY